MVFYLKKSSPPFHLSFVFLCIGRVAVNRYVLLFYLNKCKQHPDAKLKDRMELKKLIMSGKEHLSL